MSLKDKIILVTGGSRGLGLGLVEALVDQGAKVTVVARDQAALAAVEQRLGVAVDLGRRQRRGGRAAHPRRGPPRDLVLNAGATPRMGRLDQLSWEDFSVAWETDVKAGLYWLQAALNLPLKPGARVLVGSSGAAVNGSPLSGGYAGAKHMLSVHGEVRQWRRHAERARIRSRPFCPCRSSAGPGSATWPPSGYARSLGLEREAYLARFGAPLPPRQFGDHVVAVLDDPQYAAGRRLRPEGRYRNHDPGGRGELSEPPSSSPTPRQEQLLALASELRPELHRYSARLMGSVIDGEDVVQDTFARALAALDELEEVPPLRAWLFRIAHNRALDLMRSRAIRAAEPLDAAKEVADPASPDPLEVMMRREAVETAVSRFAELPTTQRSVVILKDVLDQSLEEIAAMLDLTVNAVKAHLARGRARLQAINAQAPAQSAPRPPSPEVARYVALFNQQDWDGLRAMLADDVRLVQSTYPQRVGAANVGMFFGIYSRKPPARLAPAWLEGREVIAVYEDPQAVKPSYLMWLEWRNGRISFIRDTKYVRYVIDDAELILAPGAVS